MIGLLDLATINEALREHAVVVADAIAEAGQLEGGHRSEKTGRQPAEAAIAQRRIRLQRVEFIEIHAKFTHSLGTFIVQTKRDQRVRERAPGQKLHRQVIDALGVLPVDAPRRLHPAFDQAVTHGGRQGEQPVAFGGGVFVLANGVDQVMRDRIAQGINPAFVSIGRGGALHGCFLFHRPAFVIQR